MTYTTRSPPSSDHGPPNHHFPSPPPRPPPPPLPPRGTWDSLISSIKAFATHRRLSHAASAYSTLLYHSPPLHLLPIPISALLLCSGALRAVPQGRQLHAHVVSLGLTGNPPLAAKLVSAYASCELFPDARAVAEGGGSGHPLPWNVLISAYVRNGLFEEAIEGYHDMLRKGVKGDAFTFPSVLKACGELQDLRLGREVHECVENGGFGSNMFVQNALVSMYAKGGEMGVAREVFDRMTDKDDVSWNAMISGYASKQMWDEAFEVFEGMREEGMGVNSVTWNMIAGGHLEKGNYMEALRFVSHIRSSGGALDHVTFVIGLRACSQIGCVKIGKEIHGTTIRTRCDGVETVKNALITMYSRCRSIGSAEILFKTAEVRTLVTWNCMITGYCLLDQAEEASSVFREMLWSGIYPNFVTVVTILSLSARVANLQHGRELHGHISKQGFEDHRLLWNSLVDMYSKSGRIKEARRVFNSMKDPDEVSYTSLIAGYGMQGEGYTSLKLFDEMIGRGIKPDHVSVVAVLSACSHSGLVARGEMLFDNMMAGLYGIKPLMEHYSCMVDLYARAGSLRKAEEFLNHMQVQPTTAMWASLVGACHVYRDIEIGERAATKLLEMRSDNPGHYIVIANMYAAAGNWEKLSNVRTLMRDTQIRKVPGCAWVNVGSRFHPFLVEDRYNTRSCEIYMLMEGLNDHLIDAGYVGNKHLESDEEFELFTATVSNL